MENHQARFAQQELQGAAPRIASELWALADDRQTGLTGDLELGGLAEAHLGDALVPATDDLADADLRAKHTSRQKEGPGWQGRRSPREKATSIGGKRASFARGLTVNLNGVPRSLLESNLAPDVRVPV